MKIARIALKDMGLLRDLEIKDLSPGLNLLVGPTGAGKSTIRRAIGGLFYGFDETLRRRLFHDARESARGALELTIQRDQFLLERTRNNWNASADSLRNISSGTSSQSLLRIMGDLNPTDYFTFFNFSLIDSPDLERRMVRCLTDRMGVATGVSHWESEAEYLRWREEAQSRRQRLDSLEARHRQEVAQRDRIRQDIHLAETHYNSRVAEWERQRETVRHELEVLEGQLSVARRQLHRLEEEIESLRHEIERLRNDVTYTEVAVPRIDHLTQLYQKLDRIEKEIKRTRSVQRDVLRRRGELRDQRIQLSDHEVKARHPAVISARQNLGQLEQRIDHLAEILREAALYERQQYPDGYEDWKQRTPAEQFQQVREDLYSLCQDLSRYHLQMARGRLSAENRDLRRCSQEMKRRIAWLKMRRQQILGDIQEADPAGYELIQRGEKRFCDCARHAGHLEARRRFLEPVAPAAKSVLHRHDTTELERQLADLERQRDRLLHDVSSLESEKQRLQSQRDRIEKELRALREGLDLDRLRHDLRKVEESLAALDQELPGLRHRVAQDNPLWNLRYDNLLDRASQWCRQLTGGTLHRVWIDRSADRVAVTDASGKQRHFENLGRSDQDLVCLSLSLAVARKMMNAGTPIPLVYDDLFINLDDHRTQAACEVLQQLVADGQQILLFANGRQIDERLLGDRFRHTHLSQPAIYYLPDLKDDLNWPVVLLPGISHKPLALPQPVINTPVVTSKVPLVINERTHLSDLDLIERDALAILSDNHILTVGDLLDLDPEDLVVALTSRGITGQRVDRWQSQAWLLCCVPGLRPYDARLLVGSGINEPEMLEDLDAHDVLDRLERYLATGEGQRVMRSGTDYELARVNSWMRSLRENRSTWRRSDHRSGSSRYLRRRRSQRSYSPREERDFANQRDRDYQRTESVRLHQVRPDDDSAGKLVFYLDLDDDLERAPSIGPRMAERFASIGLHTVRQLLVSSPTEVVKKLEHRRVDEKTLVDWQHQARLVCQIPNLRGHDAQLLVACDIVSPEEIIRMDAQQLFDTVVPFSESKEGQKILRSSKAPDMEEINDWIAWAHQHRSLQVA